VERCLAPWGRFSGSSVLNSERNPEQHELRSPLKQHSTFRSPPAARWTRLWATRHKQEYLSNKETGWTHLRATRNMEESPGGAGGTVKVIRWNKGISSRQHIGHNHRQQNTPRSFLPATHWTQSPATEHTQKFPPGSTLDTITGNRTHPEVSSRQHTEHNHRQQDTPRSFLPATRMTKKPLQ
jgi:hypothetical protein